MTGSWGLPRRPPSCISAASQWTLEDEGPQRFGIDRDSIAGLSSDQIPRTLESSGHGGRWKELADINMAGLLKLVFD
jgi:hypothetical protein